MAGFMAGKWLTGNSALAFKAGRFVVPADSEPSEPPPAQAAFTISDVNGLAEALKVKAEGPVGALSSFIHTQASAATVWVINHNLDRKVSADAYTSGGQRMIAEVVNISDNQMQIILDSPATGYAIIN